MAQITARKIELWPLSRLKPYANNARTHSADQVQQIAASIATYGFNNPILVDTEDGIIAGHGRLSAAQSLQLEHVPVIVLDHLTDAQRRAYILADNRLAELAQWDDDLLVGELEALGDDGIDISSLGWSPEELDQLQEDLEEMLEIDDPEDLGDEDGEEKTAFHFEFELNDYEELSGRLQQLRKRWKLECDAEVFANLVRGAS